MLYLALAGVNFIRVFLKAFQQRNVAFDQYAAILPISLALAAAEVFTISMVLEEGFSLGIILSVGAASGLGSIAAMRAHRRIFPNTFQGVKAQ